MIFNIRKAAEYFQLDQIAGIRLERHQTLERTWTLRISLKNGGVRVLELDKGGDKFMSREAALRSVEKITGADLKEIKVL